jgi:hypothetical protein
VLPAAEEIGIFHELVDARHHRFGNIVAASAPAALVRVIRQSGVGTPTRSIRRVA